MREDEVRAAIDAMPDVSAWEGLGPMEREHRKWVLDQIRRRIAEDGPRRAVASPDRVRIFMPLEAFEGYEGMITEVEKGVAAGP